MIVCKCSSRHWAERFAELLPGSWRVTYEPSEDPYGYLIVGHS